MIKQSIKVLVLFVIVSMFTSCRTDNKPAVDPTPVKITKRKVPKFNQDNAYTSIEKQVAFGHRYPGTPAHKELIAYITTEMEKYADKVEHQDFKVDFLDEKNVAATNIIATFNPRASKRVLLGAHFDTRKIAEKDDDPKKQDQPILGADDGGSGVGVLIEIARLIKENGIDIGVDFIFFDAEDNGLDGEGWCLGSEHWAKNPHIANYKADFGILVDLVGAKNAEFGKEEVSMQVASSLMNKVWDLAKKMGYSNYFIDMNPGSVNDDHVNVIRHRKIPMIDIINMSQQNDRAGFGHYHHTHLDNMDIIDKNTLRAVGKVVTATLYNYNNGTL